MTQFAPGGYPAIDLGVVPDNDKEVICRGCVRLVGSVSAQAVYITFGVGDPPQYGVPEPYLPFMGQLTRDFDALKIRAYRPGNNGSCKLIPLTS